METIVKIDNETYEEVVPEQIVPAQVIPEKRVTKTLVGLIADIEGTKAWVETAKANVETAKDNLQKAKDEVTNAVAQLQKFRAEKEHLKSLGLVEEVEPVLEEIIEE